MKTFSKLALTGLGLLSVSCGSSATDVAPVLDAYLLTRGSFEYNWWAQNYKLNDTDDGDNFGGYSLGITYSPKTIIFPNFRAYTAKMKGNNLSYQKNDVTAYYNVIKAPWATLGLGGGFTQAQSDQYFSGYGHIDDYAGHFYSALDVGNDKTKVHLYSELLIGTGMYDVTAGVKYPIRFDDLGFDFQAGYRTVQTDFNDFADVAFPAKQHTSGFYAGIKVLIF